MPQRPQRRTRSRGKHPLRDDTAESSEGAGGDRQLLASSAYTAPRRSRSRDHRKRWRIAARTAGNLSRPPAGGRRIRDLCPSSLRRADAVRGLRPNPGFGRPGRTGVAGATRRSRRLVCIKHFSDQLPERRGQTRRKSPRHTRRLLDSGVARHPERRQAILTMSALGPKATSARSVPLAKRATVTEASSPLPVRGFLRAVLPCWAGRVHGYPALFGNAQEGRQAPVTRLPKQPVPRWRRFPCESRYLRLASCEAAGLADGPRGAISAHRLTRPKASPRSLAASRPLPRERAPVERALPRVVNRPWKRVFKSFP